MGYLSIPKINVQLPIYHGTDEAVLQIALGHLTGSSLPVGGETSHSVVSGHTGLPSAKLITDLDQLKKGDLFQYTVLDRTLTYEVDEINVVLPGEMDKLNPAGGRLLHAHHLHAVRGELAPAARTRASRVEPACGEGGRALRRARIDAVDGHRDRGRGAARAVAAGDLAREKAGKKRKAAQTLESASDNHGTEQRADSGTETTEHGNRT